MQYVGRNQENKILKLVIKMLGLFSSTSLIFIIILISSIYLFFYGSEVTNDSLRMFTTKEYDYKLLNEDILPG